MAAALPVESAAKDNPRPHGSGHRLEAPGTGLRRPLGRRQAADRKAGEHELEAKDGGRQSPAIRLKPGAKLVREWGGESHVVLMTDDGFEWQGRCHRSLSVLAREITGTRWSGPRFFGLAKQPKSVTQADELANA
jgi:hypothetical protein